MNKSIRFSQEQLLNPRGKLWSVRNISLPTWRGEGPLEPGYLVPQRLQAAHMARLLDSGFCGMKQPGVLPCPPSPPPPPAPNGMLVYCRVTSSIFFTGTHSYTWVKENNLEYSFMSRETTSVVLELQLPRGVGGGYSGFQVSGMIEGLGKKILQVFLWVA